MKNPIIAFLLSFFPGLGLMYIGKKARGWMYLLGEVALIAMTLLLANSYWDAWIVSFFAGIILYIVSIIDTSVTASKHLFKNEKKVILTEDGKIADVQEYDRFKTIILSFIPGVGHFHLGLNQRGVTILSSFLGLGAMIFFIAMFIGEAEFLLFWVVLLIIWVYSFFDVMQLLNKKESGETLVDQSIFDDFNKLQEPSQKNKLLATILAIFPGASHLYLGLQKRGLQLMIAFFVAIYVMDVFRLGIFLFAIPILWFYSFFDALQKGTKMASGEQVEDEPLFAQFNNYQKWVGFGLIAVGVYYLFINVFLPIAEPFLRQFNLHIPYYISDYVQTVVLCIIFIFGGVKLMSGKKVAKKEQIANEETK